MSKSVPLTLLFLAIATCGARARGTPPEASLHGQLMTVDPQKKERRVKFSLSNAGQRDLWINGRFSVASENKPEWGREITFQIFDETGTAAPDLCRMRVSRAKISNYRLLKPGESVSTEYDLLRCYPTIERSGKYRISAYYQDGTPEPPPAPSKARHLNERLTLMEELIVVVP